MIIKKKLQGEESAVSYDISLKDPVTRKVANVPGHLMIGGTYKADYHPETGTFTPAMNTEAWLNITYNYSHYYYECYEEGIKKIYGMSGMESIPVLEDMISLLMNKYQTNGVWLKSKRTKTIYYDEFGNEIDYLEVIAGRKISCRKENIEYEVDEGDTGYYWTPTAANAIRPLYKLIALARMRPDCIWDGD